MAQQKQKQVKMQMQVGALAAVPSLESRSDKQLESESKHRVAAKAILGARAAERYDVPAAKAYFNQAMAGVHPQERPALRQMMKASLALAERRPDELRDAMQKMGQEPPSGRQLFLLGAMGLIAPPAGAGLVARVRGILLLIVLVVLVLALGYGLALLVGLPFGGFSAGLTGLVDVIIVGIVIGVLVFFGRRRQAKAKAERSAQAAEMAQRRRR